jgi:hypothetical protein
MGLLDLNIKKFIRKFTERLILKGIWRKDSGAKKKDRDEFIIC